MAKYLIHACNKRIDYVKNHLIPSMLEQGIKSTDIKYYNDEIKQGCLQSFIISSYTISESTWHLQDDVIISSNFKEMTERYDTERIVCGFCSFYSKDVPAGVRPVNDMWYSFPCIRIPNKILKGFVEWVESKEIQNKYRAYIEARKFLDTLFRIYVTTNHKDMLIYNLAPNIVDNIDYLLGGSAINQREDVPVSLYFEEPELIEQLERKLQKAVYNYK